MNKVITVSREFGSGGRELGVKLAETLGIPFYDKELISMAADDINIAEEAFRKYDEHVIEDDPLDHKIHHSFSELYKVPMSDPVSYTHLVDGRDLPHIGQPLHKDHSVSGHQLSALPKRR